MQAELVARIVLGPHDDSGWYWVSKRFLLVKCGDKRLFWWLSRMENRYHSQPSELIIDKICSHLWTTLYSGGRLSKKVISDNAAKINEFFGCEVAHLINIKKTLIIKESGDSGLGCDNPHSHVGEQ